ncbi:hypothetical protein [Wenxinia marina]|uniref:Uncharacterized protein n=1 Tax=Wenxinia marina DSM 24838 TaxID=1123501 RepID=A0A0D0NJJ4_9RHOB|nr:hypothetical protein [Wenxinia marina]KIQ68500.1 hypothetical protein Wenmar_02770 [Wenxinia marina DSM 24838]GGL66300.1 hypothetical protein GCM10011392_21100 [Wenxinia marina]
MRNAALVLGIVAGLIGMIVGTVSYGWTTFVAANPEAEMWNFANPAFVQAVSVGGPILALAGGAMAKVHALIGGVLLLLSSALMMLAFGFNVGTMFPIALAALAGLLAIAAGKPDEPRAHF